MVATRNDSNRGSVKSAASSSWVRQLRAFEVNNTILSIYSAEGLSTGDALAFFSRHRVRSMFNGNEHRGDHLFVAIRLSSSDSTWVWTFCLSVVSISRLGLGPRMDKLCIRRNKNIFQRAGVSLDKIT